MPELPEVETVRRGLHKLTIDRPIEGGEVLLPRTLAYPDDTEQFLSRRVLANTLQVLIYIFLGVVASCLFVLIPEVRCGTDPGSRTSHIP